MEDILESISEFNRQHGQTLEKVCLPNHEFELYGLQLNQMFPHVTFEGDEIDGRILVQRDPE